MHKVLSSDALEEFNANGFVRPGIVLPALLLQQIRDSYANIPPASSNWSYFEDNTIRRKGLWLGLKASVRRGLRSLQRRRVSSATLYEKTLYGSTKCLPTILQWCLDAGLGRKLGEIPFLAGHDLLLEGGKSDQNFGFHDDGFGWDIFFQTGDDLTIYVAFQEMNAETGGRLCVERSPEDSILFQDRNAYIQRFAQFCREQGALDAKGRVTREAAEGCRSRNRIAAEYERIAQARKIRISSHYRNVEMSKIDLVEGEVILFNNKLFHDVEPWKRNTLRGAYIIRCFPFYDMGLHPPSQFLNQVDCNRYILESGQRPVAPH